MGTKIKAVILFSTILLFLSLMACSDSDTDDNENIVSTWNWYETSGGIGGITETPQTTGETRKVVFQNNGDVTFYIDDEVTLSSTYTLATEITIISDEPLPVVKIDDLDFDYIYSFPYVDELELQENVIDGFIYNYSK